ncbi:hypothetical protein [Burkholderia gladioli]|uniref:hypothetical protein n=1 Tax=Burkholderia gladioli TaxID=28095 RepID=UPI00163E9BE0|nr:hypothetical protein [Burkholderia gladioli]
MSDKNKMRALVEKLRGPIAQVENFAAGYSEAADAIEMLLAEVEDIKKSSTACCDSYASENQRLSDEIEKLRAELFAARDGGGS